MRAKKEDYINKKFNKLTILDLEVKPVGKKGVMATYAICKCDCGNKTTITLNSIKKNHTTSCGCRGKETRYKKDSSLRKIYNYFDKLTPESAYWAGFIFGDGSVSKNGTIQIGLSVHTKGTPEHLLKLSKWIFKKDYRLWYKDLCVLQINNTQITKNLKKYGIIRNKTYDSCLIFPDKYQQHFLRGYFDADGWFTARKQHVKGKYYDVFSWGLCSYLQQNLLLAKNIIPVPCILTKKNNQELWEIRINRKTDLLQLIDFLGTSDTKICYKRKWDKLWKFYKKYHKKLIQTN